MFHNILSLTCLHSFLLSNYMFFKLQIFKIILTSYLADDTGFGTFGKGYDRVIRCLGFKFDFSIFADSVNPRGENQEKFPDLLSNYESTNVSDMFFGKCRYVLLFLCRYYQYLDYSNLII